MPFDESSLPDLPNEPKRRFSNLKSLRDSMSDIAEGELGPIDYDLSLRKLKVETMIRDAIIKGQLKTNGEWNVSVDKPMFGGNLTLDANSNNGKQNYYLMFQKRF